MTDEKLREKLLQLQIECFGADDEYSNKEAFEKFDTLYFETEDGKGITGYILYDETDDTIEGLRSGVSYKARGQGISKKLYKKMVTKAKRKGKTYYTYTSMSNFASINSHVQAGMRITKFINGWVVMHYEPPESTLLGG